MIIPFWWMTGCGPGQVFGPTVTPTATLTPTSTPTPPPTLTPTATCSPTITPTITFTPAQFTVKVLGGAAWFDTGIHIYPGQVVEISATGNVYTLEGQPGSRSGPEGSKYVCPDPVHSPTDCLMNGAPYGALVGKFGKNGIPFLVGTHIEIKSMLEVTLYLGANDNLIYANDNYGFFEAAVILK